MTRHAGWQRTCSLLELFGCVLWIGGFAGILMMVIPAIFNTLDMETGGRFLRRVFDGYHRLTGGIVLMFIATTLFRYLRHRREPALTPPPTRWVVGLVATLALVTFVVVGVMGPRAAGLQEAAFAAAPGDARQAAFDAFFQLHMMVRALHVINVGVAVSFLTVQFGPWGTRP